MATNDQQTTFAANRARGSIRLAIAAAGGRTHRREVYEDGSLRVRFPHATGTECEAVIVNTAGGIAGGDRFALNVDVGPGAALVMSGAAAEKVYRAIGPDAVMDVTLSVAEGAALRWLPQETILFDRAQLTRAIDIDLAANAALLLAEAVVFGRSAMGESVTQGKLIDRWRVRRGGRLVLAETLRLEDRIVRALAQAAVANGASALATVLIAPGGEEIVAKVRALGEQFGGEVGISAWNGIALARLCATDGAALRRDLVALLAAVDHRGLPRLWLN